MGCDENCSCGGGFMAIDMTADGFKKIYPQTLSGLRHLLSGLEASRDELSLEIQEVQRLIDAKEKEVKPSTVEVEQVIREAIKERWPHLKTSSVSDAYDVYVISIVED